MQRLRTVLLTSLAFSLIAVISLQSSSHISARGLPRLAFESIVDNNIDIYVWDRTKTINITQSPQTDFDPIWSSDGKLAYLSIPTFADVHHGVLNTDPTLYVWDGNNTLKIGTIGKLLTSLPTWSSDGRLAFTQKDIDHNRVYVWDGKTTVDIMPDAKGTDLPTWSIDGRLAFEVLQSDGSTDVYVWDGKTTLNVSDDVGDDYGAVWGPDGKLAFNSYRDGDNREIYVWDGKVLTNISQNPLDDHLAELAWNAKGQIVYYRQSETPSMDDVIVWDGSKSIEVVKGTALDSPPQWTPDNRLLLVYHDQDQQPKAQLWDGNRLTTFTTYPVVINMIGNTFTSPVWSPDGRLAVVLAIPAPDTQTGPGPIVNNVVHVWHKSGLTPIKQDSSINPEYVVWSADNMLAWQASMINGDAVGGSAIYVWDGENVRKITASSDSTADLNPVWEPTSN